MNSFIHRVMQATGRYTILDYAGLKIALLIMGIILGVYYSDCFTKHTAVLWMFFVLSYGWIMYRTFITHMR